MVKYYKAPTRDRYNVGVPYKILVQHRVKIRRSLRHKTISGGQGCGDRYGIKHFRASKYVIGIFSLKKE